MRKQSTQKRRQVNLENLSADEPIERQWRSDTIRFVGGQYRYIATVMTLLLGRTTNMMQGEKRERIKVGCGRENLPAKSLISWQFPGSLGKHDVSKP